MRSAWNDADRRELQERLMRLTSDAKARWGKFTAPQMVTHLADSLHMALGDLPCTPKKLPIRYSPLKQLIIYWLPFPKGVPTAPELVSRVPASDWSACVGEVRSLLDAFARRDRHGTWCDHPAFGRMSGRDWGVLVCRHTDHHLRQFGV